MPKSEIYIELDGPKDYLEILDGEKFRNSKVQINVDGKKLRIKIDSENPKALISAIGNVAKQIRIIEQTAELFKDK